MAERQKLIAVCLSEAHSVLNTGFLSELNRAAAAQNYGVVLFNTTLSEAGDGDESMNSRAVYRSIRPDNFDAIVIIYYSLRDPQLLNEIVSSARRSHVPVISIGEELPDCWSIVNSFEDSYKSLLRHVIIDHGARNTVFMAGPRQDATSLARVRCYHQVLEECGLPFRSEQILYGNYAADQARKLTLSLIRQRKMPDAIFCANDVMAVSVCEALQEKGFSVPSDVIVTGFDGTPASYMVSPRLTTCCDDPKAVAQQTLNIILALKAGKHPPRKSIHAFRAVLSESCGCVPEENRRFDALTLFLRSERLERHENALFRRANLIAREKDAKTFWQLLSRTLLPDSVVYINRSFMDIFNGRDYTVGGVENDVIILPYREEDEPLSMTPGRREKLRPHGKHRTGVNLINPIFAYNLFCGIYDVHTDDPEGDAQLIRRMSDVLNLIFTIQLGNARQQMLINDLNNTLYLDASTRLSNLRGLSRWFEGYRAEPEHHRFPLALSVYSINHYAWLYDNYGIDEIEAVVSLVAAQLNASNENALRVARISEDQFVVMDSAKNGELLQKHIDSSVTQFFRRIETHNAATSKPYFIEVNCGCTTMDKDWENTSLENLIHLALGEMYLNNMEHTRDVARSPIASSSSMYSAFSLLMEKNLLKFHFQPIVDAKSAQIVAYEALMRTDGLIQMSPLEILDVAREYHHLYDVEKATVFGIMERYVLDYSDFSGCKVFINTIPGHFLTWEDCAELKSRYESYLNCFVFELTEQDTTPDEELTRLKSLSKAGSQVQIAIDDYGTGHSNMVNVLRYSPQIIKIDRALISGIQNDSNRQLFVRNTIDFAHQNDIRVLAEGVETAEELRAVIDYGVDLIQGFFTGRPAEHPLRAVSESVRDLILEENLTLSRLGRTGNVHTAGDGEEIDLIPLSIDGCSCIQLTGGSAVLTGHVKQSVDMSIHVADRASQTLTLRNANLRSANEPVIRLGRESELTLILEGDNLLDKDGILVPPTARLILRGEGSLAIHNNRNYAVGIGANYNDPYGSILVDMTGTLRLRSAGDRVVCMGGGRSGGDGILFRRGNCFFQANGISVLGIGSTSEDARVTVEENASISVQMEGNEGVGIGSLTGDAYLRSAGIISAVLNCERCVALGSMTGSGQLMLEGGRIDTDVHCDLGVCIGTYSGEIASLLKRAAVRLHGEGNRVAGLGSVEGACDTRIESGHVSGEILAGENLLLGNSHSRVIVTGGNIPLFPPQNQCPVSPGGLPLHYQTPSEDHYEKSFRDRRESWTYTADRDSEGRLGVWIPREPSV